MTEPTLGDVINAGILRILVGLRVAIPAEVVSFSRTPFRHVKVKIGIRSQLRSGEYIDHPEIDRVPVLMPGGGGYALDVDLLPGEEVMLLVADRGLDEWLASGGPANPPAGRLHTLSNAVAIPGLYSMAKPQLQQPGPGTLYLGSTDGAAPWLRMGDTGTTLSAATIRLGEAAMLGVARLSDSVTMAPAWAAWFAAVTTAVNTVAPGSAILPTSPIGTITSASTKVTAE